MHIYQLRNIGRIRRYITDDACRSLVNGMVTSRLDYANASLAGATNEALSRLQRIQNMAARIVTRTPRQSNITPVLKQLHWLPIDRRITYKILLHV